MDIEKKHRLAVPPRSARRAAAVVAAAVAAAVAGAAGVARGQSITPVALTGWNQDLVAESTALSSITAPIDLVDDYTFYAAGQNGGVGGLPASRSFTSATNANTTFQLQSYSANNALFFNTDADYTTVTTGTLTLPTPRAYSTLSFLAAAANGGFNNRFTYTLHYADGTTSAGTFNTQDWYSYEAPAIAGLGLVDVSTNPFDNYPTDGTDGDPQLFETDVPVAKSSKLVSSIQFTGFGSDASNGSQAAIFAVSGRVSATAQVYAGTAASNGFNLTTADFATNAKFVNGNVAIFNDSASVTTVAVASTGVQPSVVEFDNSGKAYSFAGGPIAGSGQVTVNGPGAVTLGNANTYAGPTTVYGGSLTVGSGGSLTGSTVFTVSGGALTVASGGSVTAQQTVTIDNGSFTIAGAATFPTATVSVYGSLVNVGSGGTLAVASTGTLKVNAATVVVAGGGTFSVAGAWGLNAADASANSNDVDVAYGGKFVVAATGSTPAITLTSDGATTFNNSAQALTAFYGEGTVALNGTALTVSDGTFTGTISGTGSLVVAGSVAVAGTNTFTGGTTLPAGGAMFTYAVDDLGNPINATAPAGTGPITFAGGTLEYSNDAGSQTIANTIVFAAGTTTAYVVGNSNASTAAAAVVTLSGAVRGAANIEFVVDGNGTVVLANAADAFGRLTVAGGTLDLNAAVAYAGPTNVGGGTLVVNAVAGLGTTSGVTVGVANTSTGAALVLADTTARGGQLSNGTLVPVTLYGDGGGAGAFRLGTEGQTTTYVGPLVVGAGGATIGAGPDGRLTLASPITVAAANSPVTLTASPGTGNASTITLAAANAYAGETRVAGVNFSSNSLTVTETADGGLSPNAGLNLVGGGQVTVNLNGHNTAVAYLAGGATGQAVQDTVGQSGDGPTTLAVGNAAVAAGSVQSFEAGVAGNVQVVKAGAGTQVLAAPGTYTGGTSVAGGTLAVANATALGTGGVTLAGGTLQLGGTGGNLAGFAGFRLNGGAAVANNVLTLTDAAYHDTARSAFFAQPEPVAAAGFTATFLYTPSPATGAADGAAFVLQADPRGAAAVGGYGGALGYAGGSVAVTPSVALAFDVYDAGYVGFGTNGVVSTQTTTPSALTVGDPYQVTVAYNAAAHTLTETIVDAAATTPATYTATYPVNLSAVLGTTAAYVGFTGGTGGSTATQTISNFAFANGGYTAPVSVANAVTTAANTNSVLTAGVSPGFAPATTGALTLAAGSTLALRYANDGTSTRLVLTVPSLTVAATAQLDVGTTDLIVQNGNLAAVTALAAGGYAGGTFAGPGIVSSTAAADPTRLTTVGVILNSDPTAGRLYGSGTALGLFDGGNPAAGDVLVKATYFGDANLDGVVNGADYARVDAGFLSGGTLTGWYNGDFNYDGVVDASDYTLIDNAFNLQGARLSSSVVAASTDEVAAVGGTAAVPEPTMTGGIVAAAAGLLGRRRVNRSRPIRR